MRQKKRHPERMPLNMKKLHGFGFFVTNGWIELHVFYIAPGNKAGFSAKDAWGFFW